MNSNQTQPAALRPTASEVDSSGEGLTREELILRGALAAGAAAGLLLVGPFARQALAAIEGGDVAILNFLLRFEYLQERLYERGKSEINDKGERMVLSEARQRLISTHLQQERQHIATLRSAIVKLGGKPVPKAEYAFAFRFVETYFGIAATIEQSAIGIYNYMIPEMQSKQLRELAGSIVQVEGRHNAAMRGQVHAEPAPEAFDPALPRLAAISSIEKFTGPVIFEELGE
jgi:hypothetical protein